MSEQAKILQEMQNLIMNILKTGIASMEEADKMDELEDLLHQQKCYIEVSNEKNSYLGEEIACLFFDDKSNEAIDKMIESEITPEDLFGFVHYHYDDEHVDENLTTMFTRSFIENTKKVYNRKKEPEDNENFC
ncbi:hypothetical protein JHD48_02305 [Sulfurimonas sp. SAG-AH-194-I05]|nr:hypothetical protein [Sulfurimonas sp. SAG-AH-194-I05]MDF1874561.1 hypothetical protein [Sulfurimonas sp. SAG-AH-194-I05]